MKHIGERIKAARLAKNMKQEELAERIGAKYRSVSTWKLGTAKPDCLTLLRICEALNVSPDQILGYPSENPTSEEMFIIRKYRTLDIYIRYGIHHSVRYYRHQSYQRRNNNGLVHPIGVIAHV